ncbi:PTS galactitol transporter subunit IIA [Serratia ureilytica]|uniref:PTS galactitol transporter subunit IIA n=1 Tax=Serratia ureilytica TaxID=300181 RepID=UPI001AA17421|nr:PTS galactitol transporter subunit IIA [Serratia ureilytica]
MSAITVNVADAAAFKNYDEVLQHIHATQTAAGIVKETYLSALREREADYPTGIQLDGYSVAIPHCDSQHAIKPAIYLLRLAEAIEVNAADGDGKLWVNLVINLVVTDPADQLQLLKALFNHLQMADFYHQMLELPAEEAKAMFVNTIIK